MSFIFCAKDFVLYLLYQQSSRIGKVSKGKFRKKGMILPLKKEMILKTLGSWSETECWSW